MPLSEIIMSQLQSTNPDVPGFRIVKVIAFFYGIVAYMAFFVTILYAIGFLMGVFVPKTIDTGTAVPLAEALEHLVKGIVERTREGHHPYARAHSALTT